MNIIVRSQEIIFKLFILIAMASFGSFIFSRNVEALVIFEDNFDSSANWQSQQTVHKSVSGGEDISIGKTYVGSCTTHCPPQGWTSYRAASSQWSDNRRRDTFILDSAGARGEGGKGITYNVESTDDYGLWSGGSLDLWLGLVGYQELYIRMWIKFSDEWFYSTPARNEHGLQKLIRISTFNEDISTTSYNPQAFGSTSLNWPVWIPDWYYNSSYDYGYLSSAVRKAPDYDTSDSTTHMDVHFPSDILNLAQGDNQWHSYEFRVKMNSEPGVADGEWEFFLDGASKKNKNDVIWKKEGSNDLGWNWLMFLDNVSASPYAKEDNYEMSLYMDDVVVATSYVGPDYVINNSDSIVLKLSEFSKINTTKNKNPTFIFSSTKAGTLSYGGACSSSTASAISGENSITLNALGIGSYSDCTIAVTDSEGNSSTPLQIPEFTITYPSDNDLDKDVDIFDYNILLGNFGTTSDCANSADTNEDCEIDIFDYNSLLGDFGKKV